jgi:hypothetical protein
MRYKSRIWIGNDPNLDNQLIIAMHDSAAWEATPEF